MPRTVAGASFRSSRTSRSANGRSQRARVEALPRREQAARQRSLNALALMRRQGVALTKAAAEVGASVETVQKYTASALRKASNGRYRPTKSDRLYRAVHAYTTAGEVVLHTTSFRQASLVGQHWDAMRKYVATGDASALKRFAKRVVRSDGRVHHFIVSTVDIEALYQAGELAFENLYAVPT